MSDVMEGTLSELVFRAIFPTPSPYLTDPVKWVEDKTGEYLWSKQREIFQALIDHRRVAVKSAHGTGKSFTTSRAATWFIDTHPIGTAFLATTAPTQYQVEVVLWREIQKAMEKAEAMGNPLPGRILAGSQPKWKVGSQIVGIGRKPADHNESGFQGIHEDHIMVAYDEAGGIKESLFTGSSGLLTAESARAIAIGNPDDPNSYFARMCEGAPEDGTSGMSNMGWWVITISLFDTPNFTGEEVPDHLKRALPNQQYLEDCKRDWPEGDWRWDAKIYARFPKNSKSGVIPYSWIRTCMQPRDVRENQLYPVALGIDVGASEEGDTTVVRERLGIKIGRRWAFQEADFTKLGPSILSIIQETGAQEVKIDGTGVGHGLANMLADYGARGLHNAVVYSVNFGSAATEPAVYENARAEMYWGFRELVQVQAIDLSTLDEQSLADLTAPQWGKSSTGRVKLEKKEEITKRLKRSTDDGDAIVLAWYNPAAANDGYFEIEE